MAAEDGQLSLSLTHTHTHTLTHTHTENTLSLTHPLSQVWPQKMDSAPLEDIVGPEELMMFLTDLYVSHRLISDESSCFSPTYI